MAAQHGLSHINLLPKDEFEFSTLGRILKWATTAGRVLVVLTEFVVILAFGSRFYFDKKINDLNEVIDNKLAIIQGYNEVETRTRELLTKQSVINDYLKNNIQIGDRFETVSKLLPRDVNLSVMKVSSNELTIEGDAGSEATFAQTLRSFRTDPRLKQMSLAKSSFDQVAGTVKFNIKMTYK